MNNSKAIHLKTLHHPNTFHGTNPIAMLIGTRTTATSIALYYFLVEELTWWWYHLLLKKQRYNYPSSIQGNQFEATTYSTIPDRAVAESPPVPFQFAFVLRLFFVVRFAYYLEVADQV